MAVSGLGGREFDEHVARLVDAEHQVHGAGAQLDRALARGATEHGQVGAGAEAERDERAPQPGAPASDTTRAQAPRSSWLSGQTTQQGGRRPDRSR